MKYIVIVGSLIFNNIAIAAVDIPENNLQLSKNTSYRLLLQLQQTAKNTNYKGTLVVQTQKNNNIETKSFNVIHFFDGQSEYEKIIPLEGKMLSILRVNQIAQTYIEDKKIIISTKKTENNFPLIANDIENITKYYIIKSVDKERFLGQQVNVLNLLGKDNNRYSYRIWIMNNFMLKMQTLFEGKMLKQIFFSDFTHIPYNKLQIQQWMELGSNWTYKLPRMQETELEHKDIDFVSFYKGYKPIKSLHRLGKEHGQLYQIIYSDGMGQVSIFVEKNLRPFSNYFIKKKTNNSISFKNLDGYTITAVGEAPMHFIQELLETVKVKTPER